MLLKYTYKINGSSKALKVSLKLRDVSLRDAEAWFSTSHAQGEGKVHVVVTSQLPGLCCDRVKYQTLAL